MISTKVEIGFQIRLKLVTPYLQLKLKISDLGKINWLEEHRKGDKYISEVPLYLVK